MADSSGKKTIAVLGLVLLAGVLLSLGMLKTGLQSFAEGYFYGALLAASIPVGALGVRLVHALTGGRWGEPLKRYFESASRLMPAALLLWVPVFFWLHRIYPWARPQGLAPEAAHLTVYLNPTFFIVRTVAYFIVWGAIAWWLDRRNDKTDLSGFLAVLYFLVGTFASMDWVMSLLPPWYSTIFSAVFVTGQVLLAYCCIVAVNGFAGGRGRPAAAEGEVSVDQGSVMLTMVMFWAYLAFSQFLIIWMGNLPHEITWYLAHIRNNWDFMAPVIIAGHLFLPLFLLLRQSWKSEPVFLAVVALFIVLMRAGDIAWMVFSGLSRPAGALTAAHAGGAVVVVSLCLFAWFRQAGKAAP